MHLNITDMASFYNKRQYQYTYAQWLVGSVSDAARVDLPCIPPLCMCYLNTDYKGSVFSLTTTIGV